MNPVILALSHPPPAGIEPTRPVSAPTPVQANLLKLAGQEAASPCRSLPRTTAAIKPVTLQSHHPSLKERQQGVVEMLYSLGDLQCKTCGQRYSR